MKPEGSCPCSEEPATGHYSKPDLSRQYHPIYVSKIHFNIIHLPTFFSS
jgi:hypothetical protein